MLSCELCEIFKNSYIEEHLRKTAFNFYLNRDSNTGVFLEILRICIQEHLFAEYLQAAGSEAQVRGSFFKACVRYFYQFFF